MVSDGDSPSMSTLKFDMKSTGGGTVMSRNSMKRYNMSRDNITKHIKQVVHEKKYQTWALRDISWTKFCQCFMSSLSSSCLVLTSQLPPLPTLCANSHGFLLNSPSVACPPLPTRTTQTHLSFLLLVDVGRVCMEIPTFHFTLGMDEPDHCNVWQQSPAQLLLPCPCPVQSWLAQQPVSDNSAASLR